MNMRIVLYLLSSQTLVLSHLDNLDPSTKTIVPSLTILKDAKLAIKTNRYYVDVVKNNSKTFLLVVGICHYDAIHRYSSF